MSSWDNRGPILAFLCSWAPYRCYMDLVKSGLALPSSLRPVRLMCAGRMDPAMVLYAFEKGAEGVMVIGCREGECRYGPGPGQTQKTARLVGGLLHILGLETERFGVLNCAPHEKERLLVDMDLFVQKIAKLGRTPLA